MTVNEQEMGHLVLTMSKEQDDQEGTEEGAGEGAFFS